MADGCNAEGALLTVKSTCSVKEGGADMTSEDETARMLTLQSVRQREVFMGCPELQTPVQTFRAASRWSASLWCWAQNHGKRWCMELLLWRSESANAPSPHSLSHHAKDITNG